MRLIEARTDNSHERLQRHSKLYLDTLANDRVCLAGVMASDAGALPAALTPALTGFFEDHVDWLAMVMAAGKSAGELNFSGTAKAQASAFLAALQGGLMLANAMSDESIFKRLRTTLVEQLK